MQMQEILKIPLIMKSPDFNANHQLWFLKVNNINPEHPPFN
jgi:hypothetical protein